MEREEEMDVNTGTSQSEVWTVYWIFEIKSDLPDLFGWMPSLLKYSGLFQKQLKLSIKLILLARQNELIQVFRLSSLLKRSELLFTVGRGPLIKIDFPQSFSKSVRF